MATPPSNCISPQEAKALCDQWQTTRATALRSDLGYGDTCEFTMSIADLEAYIAYIKQEATDQRIPQPDGIRINFGAYSKGTDPRATIFLNPTNGVGISGSNVYSIEPLNRQSGGWPPNLYTP